MYESGQKIVIQNIRFKKTNVDANYNVKKIPTTDGHRHHFLKLC